MTSPPYLHTPPAGARPARRSSKPAALNPPCAVFPDNIAIPPHPPPLPLNSPSPSTAASTTPSITPSPSPTATVSPSPSPVDPHDYFHWADLSPSSRVLDLSSPAPAGALSDDPRVEAPDAAAGAWYAFRNGLHTPLGARHFADHAHYAPPRRRPRNLTKTTFPYTQSDRNHQHHQHEQLDEDHDEDHEDDDDDSYEDCHDTDGNNAGRSRSHRYIVNCNHHNWSGPLITCVVDSLPQESGSTAAASVDQVSNASTHDVGDPTETVNINNPNNHNATNNQQNPNAQFPTNQQNPTAAATNPTDIPPNSPTEITADQVAEGMDLQGIPWDTLPFSRADYRATRLQSPSRSRDSQEFPSDDPNYPRKEPQRGAKFYDFFSNSRAVKCSIVHFQLRNLAWATSKHDVYVMHDASVVHWNAAAKRKTQVLDLSGSDAANLHELGQVQISTMIAQDNLVIAGGFYGEMVAKNMSNGCIIHNKKITHDENAITNAIDIFDSTIMTSNNDRYVRCFDLETFEKINAFRFETPVNHATRQPLGGKMVVVAGDERIVQVIDGDSGENISHLHGHGHFSFATGWHPNSRMFATGSQDKTCRIWDIRNMSQHVSVLGAHSGAVRSLRFSSCGRYMVMAEPRDYVHIYEVNGGLYDKCQDIDLFGEIAGIALSPESEGLFIAVSDRIYSSLLEFEHREPAYVDLF